MTDWLTTLATLRSASLGAEAQSVAAGEIREATYAAERGERWAVAWVESPAWEIAHEMVGWRDVAPVTRRMVLSGARRAMYGAEAPVRTAAEILADAALLADAYREAGYSTRRCGARLGVSDVTIRRAARDLRVTLRRPGRPRAHTTDALPPTAGDRRAA